MGKVYGYLHWFPDDSYVEPVVRLYGSETFDGLRTLLVTVCVDGQEATKRFAADSFPDALAHFAACVKRAKVHFNLPTGANAEDFR